MQLLILQFVDCLAGPGRTTWSHGIALMSALLKAEGFQTSLLTLSGFEPRRLHQAIVTHRPRYLLAYVHGDLADAARRTIVCVNEKYHLPVVAVGPHATACPAEVLSIPGVHALLRGDYEQTAVDFFTVVREGADPAGLPGVWLNYEDEIVRGEQPAPLENLDELPPGDRDIFDYQKQVDLTGELHLKPCRGCSRWCGHCTNDWYLELHQNRDCSAARQSPAAVAEELAQLVGQYTGAQALRFFGHAFVDDAQWLAQLASKLEGKNQLPVRCDVRLETLDAQRIDALKAMGCRHARVRIDSGSRFIREEIFAMRLGDEQIVEGCLGLRKAGIDVTAEVFVGSPYESEITVEETLELLRSCHLAAVEPRLYYPLPGTRAAELCAENGWISGRGERHYRAGHSVLDMSSMPAAMAEAVVRRFGSLLRRRNSTDLMKTLARLRTGRRTIFGFHV